MVCVSVFWWVFSFLNDKGDFVMCGSVNMGIILVLFINYFFNFDDFCGGFCGDGKIFLCVLKYDWKEMMKLYVFGIEVLVLIYIIWFLVRFVE